MTNEPSYALEKDIYDELVIQGLVGEFDLSSFGQFLERNETESNWFWAAWSAAQPYLCPGKGHSTKYPVSREKTGEFWEGAKEAGNEIATKGITKTLEPVIHLLLEAVPFLAGHTSVFVVAFSTLLIHYANRGFCQAEVQNEMYTTLRL